MNIRHHEFNPSSLLQPYVDSYWFQSLDGEKNEVSPVQRCVPLGMTELIIQVKGERCVVNVEGEWQPLPQAYVVGVYKDAVTWKSKGQSFLFGIRLKPESLMRLFKIPAAGLFNNFVDIESFFGRRIDLGERMWGITQVSVLIQLAEQFLLSQLKHTTEERHYLYEATNLIRATKGNLSLEELSERLYVSERQLQRSFKDCLGTGPKTYQRIIRFRSAYEYVQQNGDEVSWADVSYSFGYADQAHFIKDFKQFTGAVPSTLFESSVEFQQLTNTMGNLN